MSWDRSNIGDKDGFEKFMVDSNNQNYTNTFGGSFKSIFKPFTTNPRILGVPAFKNNLYASGFGGSATGATKADSSGLNPFGPNTLGEDIISGQSRPFDMDLNIDPNDVRTFGIKTPANFLGWGFDQFGYPTPNTNRGWNVSGIYNSTAPNTTWASTGFSSVTHGRDVPYPLWRSGPLDLRWDQHRGVWAGHNSVNAGYIIQAYSSGTPITTGIYVASSLTYDAQFFDGIANQVKVTGLSLLSPGPYNDLYKVYNLTSGSFCFIVNALINNKPRYGIWAITTPGVDTSCTSSSSASDPYATSDLGYLSLTILSTTGLGTSYGGTGKSDHPSGTILIGDLNSSGTLSSYKLNAGTGIQFEIINGDSFSIKLSSGIAFAVGGVNNTITQLQGLSTPLTLSQGGTGASGKVFMDLGTTQTSSGAKSFLSQIKLGSGTLSNPSLGFIDSTNTGLYYVPSGIAFSASGVKIIQATHKRITNYVETRIIGNYPSIDALTNLSIAPLTVQQFTDSAYSNPIQTWWDRNDRLVGQIDANGSLNAASINITGMNTNLVSGNLISITKLNNFVGNTIVASGSSSGVYFSVNHDGSRLTLGASGQQTILTSTSGNRTIHFASGYNGDIAVAKVGGGTRTLNIMHGLIVGYTDS